MYCLLGGGLFYNEIRERFDMILALQALYEYIFCIFPSVWLAARMRGHQWDRGGGSSCHTQGDTWPVFSEWVDGWFH